ncbi:MAG: sister chromatid cohesion protein PDS5 [Microcoleaceae cyanobacterium]
MIKSNQKKLLISLTTILLFWSTPLKLSSSATAPKKPQLNTTNTDTKILIENLKKADEFTLNDSIDALAKLGDRAVPALIQTLENDNLLVRWGATQALSQIGKPAIPNLIQALESNQPRVRWGAATALGNIRDSQPDIVIPALVTLLKDPDNRVRRLAAESLSTIIWQKSNSTMPSTAKQIVPQLRAALTDSEKNVRVAAAITLVKIDSTEAAALVPQLREALADSTVSVRKKAALALGKIGVEAADAVPELREALKDPKVSVRTSAADALGKIGVEAADAVPELRETLKDSKVSARTAAADALVKIGVDAKDAVPELREALKDQEAEVRSKAAQALGRIGADAEDTIPHLLILLKDPEVEVRSSGSEALGRMGAVSKQIFPELITALKDPSQEVQGIAAEAIGRIAVSLENQAKTLSEQELEQAISDLAAALRSLKESKTELSIESIPTVRLALEQLQRQKNNRFFQLIHKYKSFEILIIHIAFLMSVLSLILWLRPLWLLPINDVFKIYEFKLPSFMGGAPVRPRELLLFSFFYFQPRLLDAWVAAQIESVAEEFNKLETVRDRSIYIPVPVILDGQNIANISSQNLQSLFAKERACLLIYGEGGAGKTSLACQIAQWAINTDKNQRLSQHLMLPVLIENELKVNPSSKTSDAKQILLENIRRKLQDLSKKAQPISEEFLIQLLKHRRILVILDHISEMSETTRQQIELESADFNALIITSRTEKSINRTVNSTITPLRISGNRLSSFMEAYLTQLGKRQLFTDQDFFASCIQLSTMVGKRDITILLAKLFAEQMILAKSVDFNRDSLRNLPTNIPDLILSYLNEINRELGDKKLSDIMVHQDAQAVAWECLKLRYKPTTAKIKDALTSLSTVNDKDTELRLKYLEEKLHLIQTVGASKEEIKFNLDPVAEYLAGLHLVETYRTDEDKWLDFLLRAESQHFPAEIRGFLLAVRDCYLVKIPEAQDTDFVPKELGDRSLYSHPIGIV